MYIDILWGKYLKVCLSKSDENALKILVHFLFEAFIDLLKEFNITNNLFKHFSAIYEKCAYQKSWTCNSSTQTKHLNIEQTIFQKKYNICIWCARHPMYHLCTCMCTGKTQKGSNM